MADLLLTGGGGIPAGFDLRRRNTAATVDPGTPSTPVSGFAPVSLFSRKVSEPSPLPAPQSFAAGPDADAAYTDIIGRQSGSSSRPSTYSSSGASTAVNGQPVSLFATCMTLIEKLYSFPLFEFYLFPDGTSQFTEGQSPAIIEPINVLWAAFRLGAPLCMVYNQLAVTQPLNVADVSGVRPGQYGKLCKDNVYRFVVACRDELRMPEARDFTTSELYKDDTHGFVKVLRMVQEVVSRIEAAGMMPAKKLFPIPIPDIDPTANNSDNRSKLIKEMVDTERSYIASLEVLQRYMKECELLKVLTKDDSIAIFANLNELLDFQRRFVIAMESMLALPANEQRIGQLFIQHEVGFAVYHPFCSNYSYATQKILGMMEPLRRVANIIEPIQLQGYLIKPVQRVCRYPLLLQELVKLSDPEKYPHMDELKEGLAAIKRVTETINEESRRQENIEKKQELIEKVEDWKGLNPQSFGALVLSEKFLMTSNDQEREYDLFLFETLLLCCKDIQKQKKTKKRDTGGGGGSNNAGPMYSVRGSIKISAISRVEDASEPTFGSYSLRVFWEDGADSVQFSLKCRNGEQVRLWKDRTERLVAASHNNRSSSNASSRSLQQQQRSWGRSLSGGSATAGDQVWDPTSSYAPGAGAGGYGRAGSLSGNGVYMAGYDVDAYGRRRSQANTGTGPQSAPPPMSPLDGMPLHGRAGSLGGSAGGPLAAVPPMPPVPQGVLQQFHARQGSDASLPDAFRRPSRQDSLFASPSGLQTPNTPSSAYSSTGGNVYGYPAGSAAAAAVSATQAMLAAAAAGVAPPVGFSDDEDSDGDDPVAAVGYRAPALQQQQPARGRPSVSGPGAPASSRFAAAGLPQRVGSEQMQQSVGRPSLDQPQPRVSSDLARAEALAMVTGYPNRTASAAAAAAAGKPPGGGLQVATTHAPPPLRRTPTAPQALTGLAGGANVDPMPPLPAALLAAASLQQSSTPSSSATSASGGAAPAPTFVKIKTHYQSEIFMIAVPLRTATITDLVARLERKIRLCGGVPPREQGRKMWMAYRTGGGDADAGAGGDPASDPSLLPMAVDADVERAFAEAVRAGGATLNLFVS
ncbi:hypothetical protein HK405_004562 [Cladochytrium tenue]|nr:hypothetical protein HK405_004562 [Cladochytrium tenue]